MQWHVVFVALRVIVTLENRTTERTKFILYEVASNRLG